MKIDHKAEAEKESKAYATAENAAVVVELSLLRHATLALVEQQERIAAAAETANLIAWNLDGEGGSGLRHRIDKELGL